MYKLTIKDLARRADHVGELGAKFFLRVMQTFGALVFFSGWLVLGYQALLWLDTGSWTGINLLGLFYPAENLLMQHGATAEYLARNVAQWRGLYQLYLGALYYTPLSAFLIVAGAKLWLEGEESRQRLKRQQRGY